MGKFLKKGSIFALIIINALSIVNSSSGISHFTSDREVAMKVVDSENALIGLPEEIQIEYIIQKQLVDYYVEKQVEEIVEVQVEIHEEVKDAEEVPLQMELDNSGIEMSDIDLSKPVEIIHETEKYTEYKTIKEYVGSEILVEVVKDSVDVKIRNNMYDAITLVDIDFDNSNLDIENNGFRAHSKGLLGSKRESNITIKYDDREKIQGLSDGSNTIFNSAEFIKSSDDTETIYSTAKLYFTWDGGNSTIYKDIIINVEIVELEPIEMLIDSSEIERIK